MPGYPNLWIPIVDVRDMASTHVSALTAPAAAGQRFLVSSGPSIAMKQVGAILKAHLGDAAKRVSSRAIPDTVVPIASAFSPEFRPFVPDLGYVRKVSNEKARRVLQWQPRNSEDAIIASAESMIRKSLVKNR
jgi:nucleoside-diphosphate-sugar epimerase